VQRLYRLDVGRDYGPLTRELKGYSCSNLGGTLMETNAAGDELAIDAQVLGMR
jgi:hypothetical protein